MIMKKILFILSVILVLLNISCKNSSNSNSDKTENKPKTRADSLMDVIMADHGTGMAQMNKISVAQGLIRHAIDSIGKLPEKEQKATAIYKKELESMLVNLNAVESSMNQWMDEFNIDSLQSNPDGRIQYLESEKQKVAKVKEDMILLLPKADSLLGKKVKQ